MSEPLVNVTRGPIVESVHYGDIAVVDHTGRLLAFAGDPYRVTYLRSAAKPLQALNVLLSGAADRFAFTDEELAIMCASHYGEDYHQKVIQGRPEVRRSLFHQPLGLRAAAAGPCAAGHLEL